MSAKVALHMDIKMSVKVAMHMNISRNNSDRGAGVSKGGITHGH